MGRGIKRPPVLAPLAVVRLLRSCSKAALIDAVWDCARRMDGEDVADVVSVVNIVRPVLRARDDRIPAEFNPPRD